MNLLKSLSIYTFANFFNKGLVFVLAIIISYHITEDDSGVLTMLNTYVLLLSVLIGVGSKAALTVKYFKIDQGIFRNYFSALLLTPTLLLLLLLLIGFLFRHQLATWINLPTIWVFYIVLMAFNQIINEMTLTLYRIEDQPRKFAIFNIGQGLTNFGLSLLFIIYLGHSNWEGRAFGIFGSAILFALASFVIYFKQSLLTFKVRKAHIQDALQFGLPIIPHLIGAFVIEYSDNLFLERMMGRSELGLYSYGYKFGMIIQVLATSFLMGFTPYVFSVFKNPDAAIRLRIVRISYAFLLTLMGAVAGLALVSPFIFHWLIDSKFYPGHVYVLWIGIAYFFYASYSLFSMYIHYSGKTYIFSFIAIVNVGVNLILNYVLISHYGTIGAAYATICSYIIVFVITAFIAQRLQPMPWLSKEVFNFVR